MNNKQYHKICAIIPVYNEEDRIYGTINGLKQIKCIDKIIVIDDGSSDNTCALVRKYNIECVRLNKNKGKGGAIKEGLKIIDSEYYVFIDGDLGYTSREIVNLINPVINGECDIAIGKFESLNKKIGFGLVKHLAKAGIKFYTGTSIDSVLSGQRVYTKESLNLIEYIPDRYGIEVAMTIQSINKGLEIKEVYVEMSHRVTGRDIKGFFHRGKQFKDILLTLLLMYRRR